MSTDPTDVKTFITDPYIGKWLKHRHVVYYFYRISLHGNGKIYYHGAFAVQEISRGKPVYYVEQCDNVRALNYCGVKSPLDTPAKEKLFRTILRNIDFGMQEKDRIRRFQDRANQRRRPNE